MTGEFQSASKEAIIFCKKALCFSKFFMPLLIFHLVKEQEKRGRVGEYGIGKRKARGDREEKEVEGRRRERERER